MAAPEWNFGHVAGVCDVAYIGSGDDARLVTCGADNAVYVRHPSSGEVEESFTEEHEDMVNVVAVAPDGKTFATGSDDASCMRARRARTAVSEAGTRLAKSYVCALSAGAS